MNTFMRAFSKSSKIKEGFETMSYKCCATSCCNYNCTSISEEGTTQLSIEKNDMRQDKETGKEPGSRGKVIVVIVLIIHDLRMTNGTYTYNNVFVLVQRMSRTRLHHKNKVSENYQRD